MNVYQPDYLKDDFETVWFCEINYPSLLEEAPVEREDSLFMGWDQDDFERMCLIDPTLTPEKLGDMLSVQVLAHHPRWTYFTGVTNDLDLSINSAFAMESLSRERRIKMDNVICTVAEGYGHGLDEFLNMLTSELSEGRSLLAFFSGSKLERVAKYYFQNYDPYGDIEKLWKEIRDFGWP